MDAPSVRFGGPVIDAPDVPALAAFYERFLGWDKTVVEDQLPDKPPGYGFIMLQSPDGSAEMEIQFEEHFRPPEWPSVPGGQCKQLHLDFVVDDMEEGIAWALECGATLAETQPVDRNLDHLRTLIDPAGHPFCLFQPAS